MDGPPLFGEESGKEKALQFIVGGLLMLGAVLTLIFSVVNGIEKNAMHIVLGIATLSMAICIFILWKWYRNGDLDPKFKLLIGGMCLTLILLIIVGNVYFWALDIYTECPAGFWATSDTLPETYNRCYTKCQPGFCLDQQGSGPGLCKNCTDVPPAWFY